MTSIHQIEVKKKDRFDLLLKNRWVIPLKKTEIALMRGTEWPPWIRNDPLEFFDKKRNRANWLNFLDFDEQFFQIKNYLKGTTVLDYFQACKDFQVVLLDNPVNFKDFCEKNTIRLLSKLCGCHGKILFSAKISHRGFIGTSAKSLMLNEIRLFGKKMVLADHVWVEYTKKWAVAEPLIGGNKVYVLGKVVPYKRKDGTVDYTIKASKVIRA